MESSSIFIIGKNMSSDVKYSFSIFCISLTSFLLREKQQKKKDKWINWENKNGAMKKKLLDDIGIDTMVNNFSSRNIGRKFKILYLSKII